METLVYYKKRVLIQGIVLIVFAFLTPFLLILLVANLANPSLTIILILSGFYLIYFYFREILPKVYRIINHIPILEINHNGLTVRHPTRIMTFDWEEVSFMILGYTVGNKFIYRSLTLASAEKKTYSINIDSLKITPKELEIELKKYTNIKINNLIDK